MPQGIPQGQIPFQVYIQFMQRQIWLWYLENRENILAWHQSLEQGSK